MKGILCVQSLLVNEQVNLAINFIKTLRRLTLGAKSFMRVGVNKHLSGLGRIIQKTNKQTKNRTTSWAFRLYRWGGGGGGLVIKKKEAELEQ